ncbi:hypothetical protein CRG98_017506, partial [Punica granatum]
MGIGIGVGLFTFLTIRLCIVLPELVRGLMQFLGLVAHDRILTNEYRVRCNLFSSALCHRCNAASEPTLHVLRDCRFVRFIWERLLGNSVRLQFFSLPLREWLLSSLCNRPGLQGSLDWPSLFGVGCWFLWNWPNKEIFQEGFRRPYDAVSRIAEVCRNPSLPKINMAPPALGRSWQLIWWHKPPDGIFNLNTDGASCGNPGLAGAGGIICDDRGNWLRRIIELAYSLKRILKESFSSSSSSSSTLTRVLAPLTLSLSASEMESVGKLARCSHPFHLSFLPPRPSFPNSISFRTSPSPPLKFHSIRASASDSHNPHPPKPLLQTLAPVLKTACVTLSAAAALLFIRLQPKPAVAAPVTAPT